MLKYTELEKAFKEIKKKGLGWKAADGKYWYQSEYQRSLTFYAFNDCNKGLLTTGFNHVQIDFIFNKPAGKNPGTAYYVMEYSKYVPKRKGESTSKYKNTPTAVQLPLDTFNPPQFDENNKLKVTYTDKNGKLCNVLLGPCNTPEKEQEYNCPVQGPDFVDDEDWKEKVTLWFETRLNIAINIARISTEWKGEKITTEQALAPLRDPRYVSHDPRLEKVDVAVTGVQSKTDDTSNKSIGEAEKHLQKVEKLLEVHEKDMVPVLGTGGKKSRKKRRTKRRTKRRKSIRRKKGKKTKKH